MEKQGLLFIPDISGFTRFVNETEIEHSRLIIQELLELLINSNQLALQISEVEGDAILFYRFGPPPDIQELYLQVERMFCTFQRAIQAYDNRKYCQCQACTSAIDLTLKIISHYGEFTEYNVKNFNKLIGRDIIIAHQLLKNEIEQHEYWLVTKPLVPEQQTIDLGHHLTWNTSSKQTDTGPVNFLYTLLSPLKDQISAETFPKPDLAKKHKAISISREYDTDIITLFHATGDFNYRPNWMEGVKKVEETSHYLPRVGMKCRCIMENGETLTYSTSYYYQPDHIEFSELQEADQTLFYYTLQKINGHRTRFTLDVYIENTITSRIKFQLTRKKALQYKLERSFQNLVSLVKEIKLPDLPVE